MSADVLLPRLERVRKRTADQWSARCPAHDDKGPSLSIRELPDGRVLLKCFAGCAVESVLSALGLAFDALFPPPQAIGRPPVDRRRLLTNGQALELLEDDMLRGAVALLSLAHGVELTEADRAAFLDAAGRVAYLAQEARS